MLQSAPMSCLPCQTERPTCAIASYPVCLGLMPRCPHRSQGRGRGHESWVSAPVDRYSLPSDFLVNKRFVSKPRVVDDCSASSVNSSVKSLSRRSLVVPTCWPAWVRPSCRSYLLDSGSGSVPTQARSRFGRRPAVPLHALSRSRARFTEVPSPLNVAHASSRVAMSSLSSHGVTLRPDSCEKVVDETFQDIGPEG